MNHQPPAICAFCTGYIVVSRIQKVVGERLQKKKLWTEFHVLRSSTEFSIQWRSYLEEVGIKSKALFIQIITTELFEQLISDICVAKRAPSMRLLMNTVYF